MAQAWLRLYRATVNNPKIQRLGLEAVGFWVNCLCLTDDDGYLPAAGDIAWALRIDQAQCDALIAQLHKADLIDVEGQTQRMHDWESHQFRSDGDPTARDRKRRQRDKEKPSRVTHCDSHARVTRTEQSRTEADTEQKQTESVVRAKSRAPTSTRWPADAVVSDEWQAAALERRANRSLPPIDMSLEAEMFANHFAAIGGSRGAKIDWFKTWINWALRAHDGKRTSRQSGGVDDATQVFRDNYVRARAEREGSGG